MWPNPEVQLLCYCVRPQIEVVIAEQIQLLLQKPLDWLKILKIAKKQGIMPLFYWNINTICPEAVPPEIWNELQNSFKNNARRNLFLSLQLVKLLKLFETHQIAAIPYKGAVLAATVYGNLALRKFSDLDILVSSHDFLSAEQLLGSQGYQLDSELRWESCWVDPNSGVNVDLHQGLTPEYFSFKPDFEVLWQRSQSLVLSGTKVVTLAPQDLLLILVVQLAKDVWEKHGQLIKLCDIAQFLKTHQDLDWQEVLQEAKQLEIERLLFLSLRLCNGILGSVIPENIRDRVFQDPVVKLYANEVTQQLVSDEEITFLPKTTWQRFLEILIIEPPPAKKPSPGYLCREFLRVSLSPTQADRDFVVLPKSLAGLYYLIRPLRLLGKGGYQLSQRLLKR